MLPNKPAYDVRQAASPSIAIVSGANAFLLPLALHTRSMKLPDIILLSLAVVFLVIGIDQIVTLGFGHAYWAIMLALIFFFVYNLRRRKR